MTSLSVPAVVDWKNLIPKTAIAGALGAFSLPINFPNAKVLRISGGLTITDGLTNSGATDVKFIAAGGSSINYAGYVIDMPAVPTIAINTGQAQTNLPTMNLAGTDADADQLTSFEFVVYNWNLTTPHWGTYHFGFPNVNVPQGQIRWGVWQDRATLTYDSIRFSNSGKTYGGNSYYQVDQLG